MKYKILTVLAILLSIANLNAQITKTDGPIGESLGKHDVQSIIGSDNNSFYVYRREDEKMVVQRYNKAKLTKDWETDISFKDKSIEALDWHRERLFYLRGGKIYLFIPAASDSKTLLILQVLNTDGKVDGNPKEIYSAEAKHVTHRDVKDRVKYKYSISADSSRAIYWFSYSWQNQNKSRVAIIDLKNLKLLSVQFPEKYEGNDMIPGNFAISNDGYLAFDFTYYISNKSIVHSASEDYPHYTIGIFNPATSQLQGIVPDIGSTAKRFGGNAGFHFTANNKFLASLIVTDQRTDDIKRKDQNSGIYLGVFDAVKGKVEKQAFQYFSKAWRDKYLSKDKHNEVDDHWNGGAYEFKFSNVDGANYIISALPVTQDWRPRYEKNSRVHDGLIIKINSSTNIEWMKPLPTNIYIYGNYEADIYYNKKMCFFFDDHVDNEKNVDIANVEASKDTKETEDIEGKSANTICVTYDMTGKAERIFIQNNKESAFIPLDKTVWADKNKILLYFKKGKQEHFSTLTIQ